MDAWVPTSVILSKLRQEPQQDLTIKKPPVTTTEHPSMIPAPTSIPLPQVLMESNKKAKDRDTPDGSCSDRSTATFSEQVSNTVDGNSDPDQLAIRTTVMLRNLPLTWARDDVVNLLRSLGFATSFNFVYVPMHFALGTCFGYAFVNLVNFSEAQRVMAHLDGFQDWPCGHVEPCNVHWSEVLLGLEANINRYKNSRLMHPRTPDHFRPAIYQNGQRVRFPEPTRPLPCPRPRVVKALKEPMRMQQQNKPPGDALVTA